MAKKLLLALFYVKKFVLIYHLIQPFRNKKGLIIVSLKKVKRYDQNKRHSFHHIVCILHCAKCRKKDLHEKAVNRGNNN